VSARNQPAPQPESAPVDPVLRVAADLREVAAELRAELDAVRLERRAYAELVAERDRLIGENHQSQKAILLLLDEVFRTTGAHAAANGSKG
jgi:hypothetical protein